VLLDYQNTTSSTQLYKTSILEIVYSTQILSGQRHRSILSFCTGFGNNILFFALEENIPSNEYKISGG